MTMKDNLQSNPVASTPKAPSKRNTPSMFSYSFSFSFFLQCVFITFFQLLLILFTRYSSFSFLFWHYLAVLYVCLCSRHRSPRHHAEVNYRGTIRHYASCKFIRETFVKHTSFAYYRKYLHRTNERTFPKWSLYLFFLFFSPPISRNTSMIHFDKFIIKLFYYLIVSLD